MAEVVLDANVLVALLYAADSQHERAVQLTERMEAEGHDVVLVDFWLLRPYRSSVGEQRNARPRRLTLTPP